MEQSYLIELILCLTPTEKSQILQFAALDFINKDRMRAYVPTLLGICLNHPWDDPTQKLEKMEVFEQIFPNQEFVEGKLEKIMVDAHKVVRAFLLTQRYFREENEFHQSFDFAEICRLKGLTARHRQQLARLKKMQQDASGKNAQYYYQQYLLEYAIHDEESLHNQKKGDLNIPNTLYALEIHYHLNRVALANRFLLQQKVANLETPISLKELIDDTIIPTRDLEASPFVKVNYAIFTLLKKDHPEPSDARALFDLLLLNEKNLDSDSLREFYTYLRNICVLILQQGSSYEEVNFMLHELYQDNLKRGFLHYEGKLHPSRYLGVSDNAVRVNDHKWAFEFIEKYKDEIIGETEERDIYRFNKAKYFFELGRYTECLDNIPPNSPFVDYLLAGKRLELKAFYELQSDLLSYKLDAFKMFLSRTSQKLLPESLRKMNIEFANLLTQLMGSRPGDNKRAEKLIKRIEEKKQTVEWRWLLSKAQALKK